MSRARRGSNRLSKETSPYLLQHAGNPVDWYPWGPEALDRARREDRPILLSIGYSACHWCHVMETESFEDPQIADVMNAEFVCIKVDREERPDLDAIYMDAVQAMTGHGGWPMTMFLTPAGAPFFAGTYYPPDDRGGMPSFRRVLDSIATVWKERKEDATEQGRRVVAHLQRVNSGPSSPGELTQALLDSATTTIGASYDSEHGGFGGPPKFPQAPVLEWMLRASRYGGDAEMVRTTLKRMALGGIYDQVGGGFHRYSVDERWLVPHFEKMLYDQAQLIRVYLHAYQQFGDTLFRRIVLESCHYLLRDMRSPEGAFYSTEDADSEGEEGRFYVWEFDEFTKVAPDAAAFFGVTAAGNFEGRNILTSAGDEPPSGDVEALMKARSKRVRPALDHKVLTSWNGLAIGALAEAGAALGRPELVEAARRGGRFLLEKGRREDGRLMHQAEGAVGGMLEDYAYLAEGLYLLWESTFESIWVAEAIKLCRELLDLFGDDPDGGLFSTATDHEPLVVRPREVLESATPSPSAVAAGVLLRVGLLAGDQVLAVRGERVVTSAGELMEKAPQGVATYLAWADFQLATPKEIVITTGEGSEELLAEVRARYLPNKVVAMPAEGIGGPLLEGKSPAGSRAAAYVCENYLCQSPVTKLAELGGLLS